jgi:hypothetical protein
VVRVLVGRLSIAAGFGQAIPFPVRPMRPFLRRARTAKWLRGFGREETRIIADYWRGAAQARSRRRNSSSIC